MPKRHNSVGASIDGISVTSGARWNSSGPFVATPGPVKPLTRRTSTRPERAQLRGDVAPSVLVLLSVWLVSIATVLAADHQGVLTGEGATSQAKGPMLGSDRVLPQRERLYLRGRHMKSADHSVGDCSDVPTNEITAMTFSSGWMPTVPVSLGAYCTSLVFSAPWIQQIRRSVLVGSRRLMWRSGQVQTNVEEPVAGVNLLVGGDCGDGDYRWRFKSAQHRES